MKSKRQLLREKAIFVWSRCRGGACVPTDEDRRVLTAAYWEGVLPQDPDYCVAQWVEDGFPP